MTAVRCGRCRYAIDKDVVDVIGAAAMLLYVHDYVNCTRIKDMVDVIGAAAIIIVMIALSMLKTWSM